MKNKEKYNDIVVICASILDVSFGVNKHTGEPEICARADDYEDTIVCENCAFHGLEHSCRIYRSKWLEEDCE